MCNWTYALPHLLRPSLRVLICLGAMFLSAGPNPMHAAPQTEISLRGEDFLINGQLTYPGRHWRGHRIEGLLMNSRMVQGIFDDLNPETAGRWAYPDTGQWSAERNTREFIAAMPSWKAHGLLAFGINLQGGSPEGYSRAQPWENGAFAPDGALRPEYMARLHQILARADELGMVAILGYFYFGQDQRLRDEAAVIRATDAATDWLLEHGFRNVLVEINNECDLHYDHAILRPDRVPELIRRVRSRSRAKGPLLVGTSFSGGKVPTRVVVSASDFILLHGNGVDSPERIARMVREARELAGASPKPILFNEDDHYEFDQPDNNLGAALSEHASWGYFDFRHRDEPYTEGFQSVPVDWSITSSRKKAFFEKLAEITGTSSN